jgi:hypothetical protein
MMSGPNKKQFASWNGRIPIADSVFALKMIEISLLWSAFHLPDDDVERVLDTGTDRHCAEAFAHDQRLTAPESVAAATKFADERVCHFRLGARHHNGM